MPVLPEAVPKAWNRPKRRQILLKGMRIRGEAASSSMREADAATWGNP